MPTNAGRSHGDIIVEVVCDKSVCAVSQNNFEVNMRGEVCACDGGWRVVRVVAPLTRPLTAPVDCQTAVLNTAIVLLECRVSAPVASDNCAVFGLFSRPYCRGFAVYTAFPLQRCRAKSSLQLRPTRFVKARALSLIAPSPKLASPNKRNSASRTWSRSDRLFSHLPTVTSLLPDAHHPPAPSTRARCVARRDRSPLYGVPINQKMNSLNILSARVSPTSSTAPSRSNSLSHLGLAVSPTDENRGPSDTLSASDKVVAPSEASGQASEKHDDDPSQDIDEQSPLLEKDRSRETGVRGRLWHVYPARIANGVINSIRWVLSTII